MKTRGDGNFPVGLGVTRERAFERGPGHTLRFPRINHFVGSGHHDAVNLQGTKFCSEQLDRRARLFVNQAANVRVDSARREVTLSQMFDWYKQDFGSSVEGVLSFIGKYRSDGGLLRQGNWKVSYFEYDWGINEAR